MSEGIDVKWEIAGLDKLEDALTELALKDAKRVLRKASKEAMLDVVVSMAMGAGYDEKSKEAHMRDEIAMKMRFANSKAGRDTALTTYVGPKKWHYMKAISKEYGNSRQEAEPFMRPALYNNTERIVQVFKDTLTTEIAKTQRKYARQDKPKPKPVEV